MPLSATRCRSEAALDTAPRSALQLAVDPVFGPFLFGKLLATTGVWVFYIVAATVTWEATTSTLMVGAVSVGLFVPQLFLAPLTGAQADQREPKAQMVCGRLLVVAGSAVLAAVAKVGLDGLSGGWAVVGAASVVGLGFVVGGPAQHSLLPTLVRPSELAQAVALISLPSIAARAGGPVLGTFILVSRGPAVAFAFVAATNLAFAVVVAWLPLRGRVARASGTAGSVRRGLIFFFAEDRVILFLMLAMLAVGLGSDPVVTLSPALSASFGAEESLVGAFASAFGVGAGVGYLALARTRSRRSVDASGMIGLTLLSAGMFVTAMAPVPSVAMIGLGMAGGGFASALTGLTTRLYQRVPETLRGRAMALRSMAFLGSRPLGATTSGAVADATSVSVSFMLIGGIVAGLAAIFRLGSRTAHVEPVAYDAE